MTFTSHEYLGGNELEFDRKEELSVFDGIQDYFNSAKLLPLMPVFGSSAMHYVYSLLLVAACVLFLRPVVWACKFDYDIAKELGLPSWFPRFINLMGACYCGLTLVQIHVAKSCLQSKYLRKVARHSTESTRKFNVFLQNLHKQILWEFFLTCVPMIAAASYLASKRGSWKREILVLNFVLIAIIVLISPCIRSVFNSIVLLSQNDIDILRETLSEDITSRNGEFWLEVISAHRNMDKRLEKLWSWAAGGRLTLLNVMSYSIAISCSFVGAAACEVGSVQFFGFSSFCAVSLYLVMMPLWRLANVTATCQSTWAGSDSILRLTLDHCGEIRKPETELMFNSFLNYLNSTSCGIELPVVGLLTTAKLSAYSQVVIAGYPVLLTFVRQHSH